MSACVPAYVIGLSVILHRHMPRRHGSPCWLTVQPAEELEERLRILQRAAKFIKDSSNKEARTLLERLSKTITNEHYIEDFILRILGRTKCDYRGALVRVASHGVRKNQKR